MRRVVKVAALLAAMALGLLVPAAASTLAAPAVPALQQPDGDGDGVPDDEDGCPELHGAGHPDGCPDRDGDGISEIDGEDRCPDQAGNGSIDGCPAVVPVDDFTAERGAWPSGSGSSGIAPPSAAGRGRRARSSSRYTCRRPCARARASVRRQGLPGPAAFVTGRWGA